MTMELESADAILLRSEWRDGQPTIMPEKSIGGHIKKL